MAITRAPVTSGTMAGSAAAGLAHPHCCPKACLSTARRAWPRADVHGGRHPPWPVPNFPGLPCRLPWCTYRPARGAGIWARGWGDGGLGEGGGRASHVTVPQMRVTGARRQTAENQARAHPDLNQGPADLQSAALTTELCTHVLLAAGTRTATKTVWRQAHATGPSDQGTRLQTWSAVAVTS